MLMVHNPYVQAFREAASCRVPNVNVCLHASPKLDMRRYNIPRVSEVAAFIPEDDEPSVAPRDVIVRRRDGRVQRIHKFHAAYDPLHFVLLFPKREQGWTYNIPFGVDGPRQQRSAQVEDVRPYQPSKGRTVISPRDFAAFYLMTRKDNFNHLQRCQRLYEEYIFDQYTKVGSHCLGHVRRNQDKLRRRSRR